MSALGPIEIPFVSVDEIDENAFFAPNAAIVPELESYMDSFAKIARFSRRKDYRSRQWRATGLG